MCIQSTSFLIQVLTFSGVELLHLSGLTSQCGCKVLRSVKSCPPGVFPVQGDKDEGGGAPYKRKTLHEC